MTWSIARGARTCLLGPNGAGKSTAIRLLVGAIAPTSGRACLLGEDVRGRGLLAARRRTGIVPQAPGMYADVTVRDYLDLVRRLYQTGNVGALVERLGLGPYLATTLANLSGGMQRRVVLAAALLGEPDLLLLDEPTVGLDPVAAHEVQALLRESMANRTSLLCTHNLAEAEVLCDEVVVLRAGQVLVQSSLADLRRRSPTSIRIAARQDPTAVVALLRGHGVAAEVDLASGTTRVAPRDALSETPDLLRALLGAGIDVVECRLEQATLEELFLRLIREST